MTAHCWLRLLLLGIAALLPLQPAEAQVSHAPLHGSEITPEMAEEFLRSRLEQAQNVDNLQKLLTDVLRNPGKYQRDEERKRLLRAFDQPGIQKLLDRILAEQASRETDPAKKSQLQEMLAQWRQHVDRHNALIPPDSTGPLPPANGPPDRPVPDPKPEPGPGRHHQLTPLPPPSVVPRPLPTPLADRLRELADRLRDSPLAESPAVQRMVAELDRVQIGDNPVFSEWMSWGTELPERLANWGSRFSPNIPWLRIDWTLPDVPLPSPGGGRTRGGSMPAVSEHSQDDLGPVGLVLGLTLLGSIGMWFVLGGWIHKLALRRRELRRLGPWPVRPEAVHSREELVRAFEYLSLLKLGPAARTRNHRDLAVHLGDNNGSGTPHRRHAAEQLAVLYAQARYAPPAEVLPEPDLAVARRALSFLAGAPGA
jgi:hypothetical protein